MKQNRSDCCFVDVEGILTWMLPYGAIAMQPVKVPSHELERMMWSRLYDPEGYYLVAYLPTTVKLAYDKLTDLCVGMRDTYLFIQIRATKITLEVVVMYALMIAIAADPNLAETGDNE